MNAKGLRVFCELESSGPTQGIQGPHFLVPTSGLWLFKTQKEKLEKFPKGETEQIRTFLATRCLPASPWFSDSCVTILIH